MQLVDVLQEKDIAQIGALLNELLDKLRALVDEREVEVVLTGPVVVRVRKKGKVEIEKGDG